MTGDLKATCTSNDTPFLNAGDTISALHILVANPASCPVRATITTSWQEQQAQGGDRAGGNGGQGGHEHDGAVDGAVPANDLPAAGGEGSQDQRHRKDLMQNAGHGDAQAPPAISQGEQGRE